MDEGWPRLWGKMRRILTYLRRHQGDSFDWFVKADDDTYIVVDNLRALLSRHDSSEPIWFGSRLRHDKVSAGYMSGGAGYALSRQALKLVVDRALDDQQQQQQQQPLANCSRSEYGFEDLELGRCLQGVGVVAGDSRDPTDGRPTFLLFPPWQLVPPQSTAPPPPPGSRRRRHWYWDIIWWPHDLVTIRFDSIQ